MLSINTNNASMAAVNAISKSSSSLSTSMERLATGNRINSSADDAAGKQIANRLTAQSSGMGVALSNINDATAMLQTADSMFDEMSDVLGRMKDLSTQAANGTYSDDDLQAMQDEYDELGQQMSDMLQNTTYGGTNLFGVSGTSNTGTDGLFQSAVTFQVGAESSDTMTVNISSQLNTLVTDLSAISNSFSADQADTTGTAGVSGGTELTASGSANQMITSISTAMDDVSQIQSKLGASINRLNDTANNLTSMQDNTGSGYRQHHGYRLRDGSVQYDQTTGADADRYHHAETVQQHVQHGFQPAAVSSGRQTGTSIKICADS